MAHDQDQGSFLTGFTLGLFAGATGYFLFGTDRGAKVRRELKTEWDQAQAGLAKAAESVEEASGHSTAWMSLREALYKVADWVGESYDDQPKTKKNTRRSKPSGKARFKGV